MLSLATGKLPDLRRQEKTTERRIIKLRWEELPKVNEEGGTLMVDQGAFDDCFFVYKVLLENFSSSRIYRLQVCSHLTGPSRSTSLAY